MDKNMKWNRSYIPDETIRRQFRERFESSTNTNNFVKKLVNNLEHTENHNNYNNELFYKSTKLDLVHEANEDDDFNKDYEIIDYQKTHYDNISKLRKQNNEFDESDDDYQKPADMPIKILPPKIDFQNNHEHKSGKRSFKKVISSVINWRPAKGLPRGSREYYSARESLSEEMRQFRKDAMPKMMKGSIKNGQSSPIGHYQKAFDDIIGSERKRVGKIQKSQNSTATIHPIYGSNKNTNTENRLSKIEYDTGFKDVYGRGFNTVMTPVTTEKERTSVSSTSSTSSASSSVIYDVPRHPRPVSSFSQTSNLSQISNFSRGSSFSQDSEYENVVNPINNLMEYNYPNSTYRTAFTSF